MTAIISIADLCKVYRMGDVEVRALDGMSFEVEKGEFVAIVGHSGSGKSTLMNILGCLDTPTSGTYRLDGVETQRLNGDDLALIRSTKFGFVFQQYHLLPRQTALRNVEMPLIYRSVPAGRRRERAAAALQMVGMEDRVEHLPKELSGGQQQRVAIARALAGSPAVILADEPTGALDTRNGEEIIGILESLNRDVGLTVILVTHEEDLAAHASRILTLRDGQLVSDAPSSRRSVPVDHMPKKPRMKPSDSSLESPVPTSPGSGALIAAAETLPPLDTDAFRVFNLGAITRESFDSLLANKGRALLTMLGMIIGVASVASLLALGSGASASITGQIESIGTNLIYIAPGSPRSGGPGSVGSAETLTLADAEAISALNLPLNGVAPQFNGSAQLVAAAADKNSQIVGTTPDYFPLTNLQVANGSFFDEAQERAAEPVMVLGANLAKDLFGSGQAVGQILHAKDQAVRVIGVLVPKGSNGFGLTDDQSFVPISFAQQRLFGARTPDGNSYLVASITLSAKNAADIRPIQDRIAALLRERHRLKADGTADDFQIINQASLLSIMNTITSLLTTFLAAIAGISLMVGGIGIMNIMLVSVTERTKEIGLRKAVGARAQDILMQFVLEALAISLLGGLVGLALGMLLALAVTLSGLMTASVSLGAASLAIGFSMGIGLFFGIYPARRAARLNPIDALRYE